MREEIIILCVMAVISAAGSIVTGNSRKKAVYFFLLAAVAGSLVAGMGVRFREIVEGPFGFLDSALSVFTAFIFVYLLDKAGVFSFLLSSFSGIRNRTMKSVAMLFLIALPAMLSGFATASILTTGRLVGKALKEKGTDGKKASVAVALGSFLGMVLPPACIPAMIAANGAGSVLPTPYQGFFLPLLVMGLPSFVAASLILKGTFSSLDGMEGGTDGRKGLFVLLAVLILVLVDGLLPSFVYIGGSPLYYTLATIVLLVLYKGFGGLRSALENVSDAISAVVIPVAFMFALGSFIEVSSMTGVRGLFSLRILPYTTTQVSLVLMAASLLVGFFLGEPLPAFIAAYAVFPIGWLASTVIVSGISASLSAVSLLMFRGGIFGTVEEETGLDSPSLVERLKAVAVPLVLLLVMGVIFVVKGDALSFLIV